ncbi:MAG: hypothetical protein NC430_03550 [bacterium]|nr:hypothetical protein [bacterium]
MKELQKLKVENRYAGSNWNFEKTTKYIYEINGNKIEAGYFEHYMDGSLIKTVIELPQSYGCPGKCKFCASSSIDSFLQLDENLLEEMFERIYCENGLDKSPYVLLTMTGIGDIFFNFDNVKKFLINIKEYRNLYVTLSSCFWNGELLKIISELNKYIRIKNIQITYVTSKEDELKKIIPFYQGHAFCFDEIIQQIKMSDKEYYRINYIMIKGINDSKKDFDSFRDIIGCVRDKVIVRIAKLNETGTTKRNGLVPTDISTLESFHKFLQQKNINSYVFYAYKNDNMNCGQLITEE